MLINFLDESYFDKLKHTGHVKVLSKTPITDDCFLFDEYQLESRRHSGLQLANVY